MSCFLGPSRPSSPQLNMTHPTSLYIGNTEFHARRENVPNSNPETTTQFTHVYDMRHLPIVEVGEPIALNGVFLVTSDDGTLLSSPTSRMNFHAVWEDGSTLTRIQLELNGLKFRTPADFLQANPEIRRIPTFQRAMEAGRWYIHRGWEVSILFRSQFQLNNQIM